MNNERPQLINGELYHAIIRAVGDTVVFDDEKDFYRGVFSIYEFNNSKPVIIRERRNARDRFKGNIKTYRRHTSVSLEGVREWLDARDRLVDVLAFSFMPNHLHLILKQLKDNGITEFMKKVGGGYARYFNDKYSRKGHLFNRFKIVHIKTNDQLKNAFVYVHTNLISLIEPCWKEKGIENPEKVSEFLENNKRHSYSDYLGKKNFTSVTQRDFLSEVMGGPEGCKAEVDNWIVYKKEMRDFGDIILE